MTRNPPLTALAAALLVLSTLAVAAAEGPPRCRERCAPSLRQCLESGRPAMRGCLQDCRRASGGACPAGVDLSDCTEATDLQICVGTCRDNRRREIRACVQAATDCNTNCSPSPGPTVTPTPR